jgi:pimeloyl-ACP methyl ester carboxylesterase
MGTDPPGSTATNTVVLIHGLWMTPRSWEKWVDRYTDAGLRVLAPAWPGLEGDVDTLRRDPSPVAPLTITKIVGHYERIIRRLDQPPIIMGHSFGGGFVQVLIDRGLGAAGVAIDSAPVRGTRRLPLSTLRSSWPVLRNPANWHRAVPLTPEQFHYAFTNTLTVDASQAVYDRYHIPGTGHVLFEGALAELNPRTALRVDFRNHRRAPLLLIGGEADHVIPSRANQVNARRYRKSQAVTEFRSFPGRSHYTLGQAGWEAVADYALDWATTQAATHASSPNTAGVRTSQGGTS